MGRPGDAVRDAISATLGPLGDRSPRPSNSSKSPVVATSSDYLTPERTRTPDPGPPGSADQQACGLCRRPWKKWPQDVREIWEGLPRTQDLWLLQDCAEHEHDYLMMARTRDQVMGIPIESDDELYARYIELYPHPPVCSHTGWCRDYYFNQACSCDKSCFHDLNCACA